MSDYHIPVMLNEVLENLQVKPGEWCVDCNLGGGGHTAGILERGGKVIGIDLDPEAIKEVAKNYELRVQSSENVLRAFGENLILVQGNFADLKEIIGGLQGVQGIQGVFYDLGVSSHQLETPERGFSFNQDAPLDMRMDTSKQTATAADLVNGLHEKELAELFWKLGEESWAKKIAQKVVESRKTQPITTTTLLAKVVESVKPREGKLHPATKVFQALRIAVNDELNSLRESLPQAWEILQPGGRLVVISFHSLEDRVVKESFREFGEFEGGKIITKKPLEPTEKEVLENPRARSGKLRVVEKV
jgi:16S rRNA (cytosine1402-N4)-methyltransferase